MATNPYLADQAGAITNQVNRNLQTNILPGIGSSANMAGGYGGSRQGVAEGLAIGQTNQGLSNSLANLYGTNYQQDQSNDINRTAVNNSYNLGLGNLGLGAQGQQNNFYTQNRSLDQSGAQLGANLYGMGNSGYLGQGTGITGIGNTQQQAPWTANQNAGNIFSQFSGLGGGQTTSLQGSALGGALGGGLAGAQLAQNLGLGGNAIPPPTAASTNNGGFGNGYYYGQQDLGQYFGS